MSNSEHNNRLIDSTIHNDNRLFDDKKKKELVVGILINTPIPNTVEKLMYSYMKKPLVVYAFTHNDIDWNQNTVNGYFISYSESTSKNEMGHTWSRGTFPLPDVIYNRVTSKRIYHRKDFKLFLETIIECKKPPIINPYFFDKATIHRYLLKNESLEPYIPKTYISPRPKDVKRLITSYKTVFLKPSHGTYGIGIYKITQLENGSYLCESRFNNEYKSIQFASITSLFKRILPKRKRLRYIAQQGIHLANLNNSFFDFRIHMNKNGENQWHASAIGANVVDLSNVTTHGGWIKPYNEVLEPVFGHLSSDITEKIKLVSLQCAETIERNLTYNLGELGLDIGVDHKGHIWILEVNARPGVHIFEHSKLKENFDQSIQSMIDYFSYLAQL
ncbi:YheC/YheD family endospore coat-associated protein [Bacillus sp. Marseille-P3661]|uniref:YheC/YheD family endospore coat-associated protein n=1 Tax=Bacillus sp. Marseille-P3661 TaxID=1936234 RepID=UPI000C8473CF|nr:YheC/YheD family protein [Bacillus sp. Marseille-P3661]